LAEPVNYKTIKNVVAF